MMAVRELIATRGDARLRLDRVLQRQLTDLRRASRTRVQAWIRLGCVSVNGLPASRPAARVAQGDRIAVQLEDETPRAALVAEPAALSIVYEDEDFLAVNKPAGMVAHPTYRHTTGTLLNGLLWLAREWPAAHRPSLVGRLDKLTSGLVLVARTRAMHASLQRALASGVSRKDYVALVYGRVARGHGVIDLRLHRDDQDRRRVRASTRQGQPSITEYERLSQVVAPPAVGLALLRCRLITGRMHQIRVHLAAHGWPIVGDPVYGAPRWTDVRDEPLRAALQGFPRQALHAWQLAFPHPRTGAPIRLEAPLPADMAGLISACRLTLDRRASRSREVVVRSRRGPLTAP